MALKIVFLFAMVALIYGSPAIQADKAQPEIVEGGMQAIQEMIAQAAEIGQGTLVLQFGDKEARGGSPLIPEMRRFCANVRVRVGNGYITVYKCW